MTACYAATQKRGVALSVAPPLTEGEGTETECAYDVRHPGS